MFKNIKPHVVLLRTAAVLLTLVVASSAMVAGRYARYVTTASYSEGARVARFNIMDSTTPLFTNVVTDIKPGDTAIEAIRLKNYGETSVSYTITVQSVYNNIPLEFEIKEEVGGTQTTLATGDLETEPASYTGTIGPNQSEKEYALYITWPVGPNDLDYIGKVDSVRVTVVVAQVD